jgi:hypothetical protein
MTEFIISVKGEIEALSLAIRRIGVARATNQKPVILK